MSPSLVAPSLDELSKDLNYASMELDVANLFDLDMSLFDFGHNLDLDILSDPKGKSKCPRGRQLQYERNYRSNQKVLRPGLCGTMYMTSLTSFVICVLATTRTSFAWVDQRRAEASAPHCCSKRSDGVARRRRPHACPASVSARVPRASHSAWHVRDASALSALQGVGHARLEAWGPHSWLQKRWHQRTDRDTNHLRLPLGARLLKSASAWRLMFMLGTLYCIYSARKTTVVLRYWIWQYACTSNT